PDNDLVLDEHSDLVLHGDDLAGASGDRPGHLHEQRGDQAEVASRQGCPSLLDSVSLAFAEDHDFQILVWKSLRSNGAAIPYSFTNVLGGSVGPIRFVGAGDAESKLAGGPGPGSDGHFLVLDHLISQRVAGPEEGRQTVRLVLGGRRRGRPPPPGP